MRAFIYDKYGYYPPTEEATSFEYNGYFFKLELSEKNDYQINELRILLDRVNKVFYPLGSDVILTRDNHYVSNSEYGPVVLICVKNGEVNINSLYKMHYEFFNKFEEKILPSLPIDNKEYKNMRVIGEYALYMIENAIQYLLDMEIYYGDDIKNVTLAHKRLDKLDTFYLFNPFNLVIDSPMRDLGELYKNNQITIEELTNLLNKYNITSQDASLLMARCIYPSKIVDIYEDYYELKKDVKPLLNKYYTLIDTHIVKLKKLHKYLVNNYKIRPINWLK